MAYTHLTMKELGWIETYFEIELQYKKSHRKLSGQGKLFTMSSTI